MFNDYTLIPPMSFYTAPACLQALAAVYAPDADLRARPYAREGKLWLLPATANDRQLTYLPFMDYFEPAALLPYEAEWAAPCPALRRLPRAVLETVDRDAWFSHGLFRSFQAAPVVNWGSFQTWEDFQAHVRQRVSNLWRDSRRRWNKLERQLGSVSFHWHDPDPATLAACISWKSSQFAGIRALFANPRHRQFFSLLAEQGFLTVSSLRVPHGPVAVVLGVTWQQRYYYWIPSYDPAHADCSPGRLLLEALLAESHRQGHDRFEFMLGDEGYKWQYVTHTHLIGALDSSGWAVRRRWLKRTVYPWRQRWRGWQTEAFMRAAAHGA
jgi:Acetyltransferase (GNAT) domain